MTDRIIDIREYLDGDFEDPAPESAFALWGADGERSRFALPLWRIIYLATGDRGVIGSAAVGSTRLRPLVVLDLRTEPARTDVSELELPNCGGDPAPALFDRVSDVVVHLGTSGGRVWFVTVDGGPGRSAPLDARTREDILFLCGECAGLLFLRDLATTD